MYSWKGSWKTILYQYNVDVTNTLNYNRYLPSIVSLDHLKHGCSVYATIELFRVSDNTRRDDYGARDLLISPANRLKVLGILT